jgi:1-aminocyclopropane-1-carboxylate deaminase/D-cysteine desulfhydrase-like pyridoxal-dependent ACC family enzyme
MLNLYCLVFIMVAKLNKILSRSRMWEIKNSKVATSEIYDGPWLKKNIALSLLRLDLIHPVISGNKIFKLSHFLQKAIELNLKIITFGGAYSNHLAATALACKHYNVRCIGMVRGEEPPVLSPTLLYCLQQDMQLEFISRNAYGQKEEKVFHDKLQAKFGDHVLIPEGGFSEEGVIGAAEIYKHIPKKTYTHICCPVGTATTIAG